MWNETPRDTLMGPKAHATKASSHVAAPLIPMRNSATSLSTSLSLQMGGCESLKILFSHFEISLAIFSSPPDSCRRHSNRQWRMSLTSSPTPILEPTIPTDPSSLSPLQGSCSPRYCSTIPGHLLGLSIFCYRQRTGRKGLFPVNRGRENYSYYCFDNGSPNWNWWHSSFLTGSGSENSSWQKFLPRGLREKQKALLALQ